MDWMEAHDGWEVDAANAGQLWLFCRVFGHAWRSAAPHMYCRRCGAIATPKRLLPGGIDCRAGV